MGEPASRRATYDDVLGAPENTIAEVINGVLRLEPRPALSHASAATLLSDELGPFRGRRGGPGGWIILFEPELHLDADVVVPDLAGWRRERMPRVPDEPYTTLAPDWVCEVLSKGNRKKDRAEKLPVYARAGVRFAWLLDPVERTLEVLRLESGRYSIVATYVDDAKVRAEPFGEVELALEGVWGDG